MGLWSIVMAHFALQFGRTEPNKIYRERPSVYGICLGPDEKIAVARIGLKAPYEHDLPGGGVEQGESEADALMREFQEETGLTVWPSRAIGRAGQFWIDRGAHRNSLGQFFEVELSADDDKPTEADHHLVWMAPYEAAMAMRHDSHAWAIMLWDRQRRQAGKL